MDTNLLRSLRVAVCHAECADGLTSALLLKDALPNIELKFVQYQTDEYRDLTVEPGMIFADFSPPANRAQEFVDAGALILDHHIGARDVVVQFGANGVLGDSESGAVLVYREAWLPLRGSEVAPELCAAVQPHVLLTGIRDTWAKTSADWDEAVALHALVMFPPRAFWLDTSGISGMLDKIHALKAAGLRHILMLKQDKGTAMALRGAFRGTSAKGTRVVMFEGVKKTSDAAEALGDQGDIVVGFGSFLEDGALKTVYSLRSHTGYDVSQFAKSLGGGGHKAAAGFNVPVDPKSDLNLYGRFLALLNEYETEL